MYVFELEEDFARLPYRGRDGSYVVEFALGYDLNASSIVVMWVALLPDESEPEALELCFGIRQRMAADPASATAPDYSSTTARRFIPPASAGAVLGCVLEAVRHLVTAAGPKQVVMETFESHLPAKAMKKYERVAQVMNRLAYRVALHFRDAADGKDYWLFTNSD